MKNSLFLVTTLGEAAKQRDGLAIRLEFIQTRLKICLNLITLLMRDNDTRPLEMGK